MKEIEKNFIEGPIDPDTLPHGATLTKRFPVKQKNKIRPIDDYRSSMVNSSVSQPEGVSIHSLDHICAMIALWMNLAQSHGVECKLASKCWDLKDAYKQVPLSDQAYELDAYLAVYNPVKKRVEVYRQKVLPFGSIASVVAFLTCSMGLWAVGATLLKLCWSAYFDDFLSLTTEAGTKHTDMCITMLFSLLGWKL